VPRLRNQTPGQAHDAAHNARSHDWEGTVGRQD
jgi:hypothetical protein